MILKWSCCKLSNFLSLTHWCIISLLLHRFDEFTLLTYDVALELGNEVTDIIFGVVTLQQDDPILFFISMAFLALSLIARLVVALNPYFGTETSIKRGYLSLYFVGVLVSLIEPLTGERIIDKTVSDDTVESWKDGAIDETTAKNIKLR